MLVFRRPILFAAALSIYCSVASAVQMSDGVPVYSLWQGAMSEARRPYERELMELLLTLSEEKYGPAKLVVSEQVMTEKRALQKVRDGASFQIYMAPTISSEEEQSGFIELPHGILKNLLGYRRLIIRKEDRQSFEEIESVSEFRKKVAGQGAFWADNKILRDAGIQVLEGDRFESLFPMLQMQRFDYLPLGISEAADSLQFGRAEKYGLVLAENLVLYYPLPLRVKVSIAYPQLAERLAYGMEIALSNGDFDSLFNCHHVEVFSELDVRQTKLIVLPSLLNRSKEDLEPVLLMNARRLSE